MRLETAALLLPGDRTTDGVVASLRAERRNSIIHVTYNNGATRAYTRFEPVTLVDEEV